MSEIVRQYEPPNIEKKGYHDAAIEVRQYGNWEIARIVAEGGRDEQQDREACIPFGADGFASIICDGHGNLGDVAAQETVRQLIQYIESLKHEERFDTTTFQEKVTAIDTELCKKLGTSGTTLLCTYSDPNDTNRIHVGYVGDSEARVVRANGALERITWPHNYTHTTEQQRFGMAPEDAKMNLRMNSPTPGGGSLAMTRSIGDKDFPDAHARVEWKQESLARGDVLILASDGLWDRVDSSKARKQRLRDIATTHPSARDVMNIFLAECLTDGWTFYDNVSMHIITGK